MLRFLMVASIAVFGCFVFATQQSEIQRWEADFPWSMLLFLMLLGCIPALWYILFKAKDSLSGFTLFLDSIEIWEDKQKATYPIHEVQVQFYPIQFGKNGRSLSLLHQGKVVATYQDSKLTNDQKLLKMLSDLKVPIVMNQALRWSMVSCFGMVFSNKIPLSPHDSNLLSIVMLAAVGFNILRIKLKQPSCYNAYSGYFAVTVILSYFIPFQYISYQYEQRPVPIAQKLFRANRNQEAIQFLETANQQKRSRATTEYLALAYATVPDSDLRNYPKAIALGQEALSIKRTKFGATVLACAYFANQQPELAYDLTQEHHLDKLAAGFKENKPCGKPLPQRTISSTPSN